MNVRCLIKYFLADPDADVRKTKQPQTSCSLDSIAEQSTRRVVPWPRDPNLLICMTWHALGQEGTTGTLQVKILSRETLYQYH